MKGRLGSIEQVASRLQRQDLEDWLEMENGLGEWAKAADQFGYEVESSWRQAGSVECAVLERRLESGKHAHVTVRRWQGFDAVLCRMRIVSQHESKQECAWGWKEFECLSSALAATVAHQVQL